MLSKLYVTQDHYYKAEALYLKRKVGEDYPHTLETKNNLAVLYKEQALLYQAHAQYFQFP